MKEELTNEQIQAEIERLKQSPYVKLARKSNNQALKQKLYTLRYLENKGKALTETSEKEVE